MPDAAPDPSALLGLKRGASPRQAAAALARLRALHHPDAGGDPRRWAEIEAAHAAVVDGRSGPDQGGTLAAVAVLSLARPEPGASKNPVAGEEQEAARLPIASSEVADRPRPPRQAERMSAWLASTAAAEVTEAGAKAEIRRLDAPVVRGRLSACQADRRVGMLILALRGRMAGSNLPAHRWYPEKLGLPRKRALVCQKLAVAWDLFVRAHRWFTTVGERAGWRVSAATGAAYALEVIGLHRRAQGGEAPGDREDAQEARREARAAERDADRLAARADREAQVEEGAPVGRDRGRADLLRALAAERERTREVEEAADRDRLEAEWSRAGTDKAAARQARAAARWRLLANGWKRRAKAAQAEIAALRRV